MSRQFTQLGESGYLVTQSGSSPTAIFHLVYSPRRLTLICGAEHGQPLPLSTEPNQLHGQASGDIGYCDCSEPAPNCSFGPPRQACDSGPLPKTTANINGLC